jgi:hypothetical protein
VSTEPPSFCRNSSRKFRGLSSGINGLSTMIGQDWNIPACHEVAALLHGCASKGDTHTR